MEFNLQEVKVNTLDITRTFLDKVMSVKRHAICGTLPRKVRHIYDVTMLFKRDDIQDFLKDTEKLKYLLKLTKETGAERNDRNKSAYVWPENEKKEICQVKLEIGSSVRPDPFSKKSMKTYIQEYLEEKGMQDIIVEFNLQEVKVNTLDITRTFLDKVMSVKRHAICGTLPRKVRHIYDVTMLFKRDDIQDFLKDTEKLKYLLKLTKETDNMK